MNKEHWSKYWEDGALTSLPEDFSDNYDGEIYDYWFEFVKTLDEDSVVLDVCTGNGAVAILIAEISEKLGKDIKIVAVDAAKINTQLLKEKFPDKVKYINSIEFIDCCRLEDLNKKHSLQVNAVVSQYGIEYCDLKTVAKVLDSILQENGRINFITHSPSTDILKYMLEEEGCYKYMASIGTFELIECFKKKEVLPAEFKKSLSKILKNFNTNGMSELLLAWHSFLLQINQFSVGQLIQNKSQVVKFYDDHMFARERANDLLRVSKKVSKNRWYQDFLDINLTLKKDGVIWYKGFNAGHYYCFQK